MSPGKAGLVSDTLGAFLQIGGFSLMVAGVWIVVLDFVGSTPILLNVVGPTILLAGTFSFTAGSWMIREEARREEQSYWIGPPPKASPTKRLRLPIPSKMANCPSCGYENDLGGIFCIACNSPLWSSGKPTGPTPERSVVMRKVGRVVMMRKLKRVVVYVILALAISTPFVSNLAVGYIAVSNSSFGISFVQFVASGSAANGTFFVAFNFYSPGNLGGSLTLTSPRYITMVNNITRPNSNCPSQDTPCVAVLGVSGTQLDGSTVTIRMTGVAAIYMYTEQIIRSLSIQCDYRCTLPGGYAV